MESPNLEFEYGDTDALTAELSGEAAQSRGETVYWEFNGFTTKLHLFPLKQHLIGTFMCRPAAID